MVKVITYGTYDFLHYGHIRLLERAKGLGDYLIVGITTADFDKVRGKINVQQSLMERVEAVKATGIADEIIIEEYEGQKIDDIQRYEVDIFAVGSDWTGKFDYLNEYCRVIYLERTDGISSTELREQKRELSLGLVGNSEILNKFVQECSYVNGIKISGIFAEDPAWRSEFLKDIPVYENYRELLGASDAVYIISSPASHYGYIREALDMGRHILCESPMALSVSECEELLELAEQRGCILMEAIKTAYATAYHRMLLLIKTGIIGKVAAVDATCTSLRKLDMDEEQMPRVWNSINAWGPTALLPIFQILGTDYIDKKIITHITNEKFHYDDFTKIDFVYPDAVAALKVGQGVKSEGELVVSGTDGYIYVPAPWWKTEYFEMRFERAENNRRYFYQLDGEGIRYEIVSFVNAIEKGKSSMAVSKNISIEIARIMDDFMYEKNIIKLQY